MYDACEKVEEAGADDDVDADDVMLEYAVENEDVRMKQDESWEKT
jgi:hypothetical protein